MSSFQVGILEYPCQRISLFKIQLGLRNERRWGLTWELRKGISVSLQFAIECFNDEILVFTVACDGLSINTERVDLFVHLGTDLRRNSNATFRLTR
jgi:hypothetical protein